MTSTPQPLSAPARPAARRTALRLLRGRAGDAPWARPGVLALLVATAVLYLAGLGASGWANPFYSAAVQAGATSWSAFFYGSLDAAGSITVDKTPGALWIMELSARLFGVNAWSILVPQALMGVGTVGLLYATVRRSFAGTNRGAAAGLLAGAAMALTPVAALMFRFNNPDALLVLLLAAAAYATLRAAERGAARWLVPAGAFVGFAFLAKMLQAFVVVPVFAAVYLVAAPVTVRRRLQDLCAAGGALIAAGGWWVAIVALVPAGSRPYIGGSQHNSVIELALGYNGLGRLTGDETGGLGNTDQDAGPLRLFGGRLGGQVAWLLPAALLLLAALLWTTRRAPRTDRTRAAALLWGGWLVLTGLVFSLMNGIFHAYYTVALAQAIAALFGMGVARLWALRGRRPAAFTLAGGFAVTAVWAYVLLARTPSWYPWLRWTILVAGLAAAVTIALPAAPTPRTRDRRYALGGEARQKPRHRPSGDAAASGASVASPGRVRGLRFALGGGRRPSPQGDPARRAGERGASVALPAVPPVRVRSRRYALVAVIVAAVTALAGPAAYAAQTAATPHTGAIPSAGPSGQALAAMGGAPGGHRMGGPGGGNGPSSSQQGPAAGYARRGQGSGQIRQANGQVRRGERMPGRGGPFAGGRPGSLGGHGGRVGSGGGPGGGPGGLLRGSTPSAALTRLLTADAGAYTWVAATVGANNAAGYQLAAGRPVMALGGFNGTDPSPTLARFQEYVAAGRVHYFVGGSTTLGPGGGPGSGSQDAQRIAAWVERHYTARTIGGTTVYDLGKR